MKTEPEEYSWDDLAKKGAKGDAWTGVRNFTARRYLKEMKKGERAFLYHTGEEKRIMGIVEAIREAYPDPTDETGKFVAVDVKAVEKLPKPVSLSTIKADRRLADMLLVHQPRLSVQPVLDKEWEIICKLGGL
jgi:predicted RNA-binding protein with PUA-like domain